MKILHPNPLTLMCWRLRLSIYFLLPLSFCIVVFFMFEHIFWFFWIFFLLLYLFMYFIYLPLFYKNHMFTITNGVLTVSEGVFYLKQKSISIDNIQFITVSRNLSQRIYKLSTIIVHGAGGAIFIHGVLLSEVNTICSCLGSDFGEVCK